MVVNPHGVLGYLIALVRPPWGWSTGFLATPLDLGATPDLRLEEAEVILIFLVEGNADLPREPIENIETIFLTPEGSLTNDRLVLGSILRILADEPGLVAIDIPFPGCSSKWLTATCLGNWATK